MRSLALMLFELGVLPRDLGGGADVPDGDACWLCGFVVAGEIGNGCVDVSVEARES